MSRITMQDVAVMSVQYVQYSFPYYLQSMEKCGLSKVDFWGGAPHYCRLDHPSSAAARRCLLELRRQIEDHGMKTVIYTPETLGYPFSYSDPGRRLRDRTVDYMRWAMEDALTRAFAFVKAGADGIMIHSRKKDPAETFEFVAKFRAEDRATPIVVVPTSFNSVTEEEFKRRGVNIVIYANQLMRSEVPAMTRTAETILRHHRALEADAALMPFKDIIRMIPEMQ